ncbi:hypothetical protein JNUCC1_03844 [Lentibacillus sp. JNUCC-1]|uniref:flagellar hook-length control protein FliK n=1 Tax=Lentibacillus sp. JNUCC-1 TaxID=2654513 RepID=UPI0012E927A0|nr:flagellar hook-length control protein FliK [Lentibacillus sp. JNUCC-1]MUV39960.1 hypothetical protein [Lentibacillus sp. JNUCC-1]
MNAMQMLKQQDVIHGRSSLGQSLNNDKADSSTVADGFQLMLQHVRHNSDSQPNAYSQDISDQDLALNNVEERSLLSFLQQLQANQTIIKNDETQETPDLKHDLVRRIFSGGGPEPLQGSDISKDSAILLNKEALKIIEKLLGRIKQEENLFSASEFTHDIKEAAVQLLEILKAIEQTGSRASQSMTVKENLVSLQNESGHMKAETIWQKLINTFNKRADLAVKQQYNTEARITSQDVGKWLRNALKETKTPVNNDAIITKMTSQTMPIARVEQFVIHTAPHQPDALEPDKQLMEQFQKAIQSSRFLMQKEGGLRLNFALRPENLGEMTVRLAQINGQMTVKILVSTHAAKEMMEKNIHQLKHMFSPHQVVIERQEVQVNQNQGFYSDQKDQGEEDTSGRHHPDQSEEHDHHHEEDRDTFQDQLSDILDEKA